jgi:hypothetical protein
MRHTLYLTAMLLLSFGASTAQAHSLPAGWRLPNERELADAARAGSPHKFTRADGDFNGDGVQDIALQLLREDGSEEGLWVELSQGAKRRSWSLVSSSPRPEKYRNSPLAMGVDVQPRGRVKYLCFDSAKVCDVVEHQRRPTMDLQNPGILYFKLESAASMYVWSATKREFEQVWLSD